MHETRAFDFSDLAQLFFIVEKQEKNQKII